MEDRLKQKGVDFDLVGIGWGMRGAVMEIIVKRFEYLVDMYKRNVPKVPIVFNYSPESTIWSVAHRVPMREDCAAVGKPGKLLVSDGILIRSLFQFIDYWYRAMRRFAMRGVTRTQRSHTMSSERLWPYHILK